MRAINPYNIRSAIHREHRERYAAYIQSALWYQRRVRWAKEELETIRSSPILCRGGCGKLWSLGKDDLHHCDYTRLGDEAHKDLWPMCRVCHDEIHRIMDTSRSYKKLDYPYRNLTALSRMTAEHTPQRSAVDLMKDFL